METLEELEKRKKELELRRDIAHLERRGLFFSSYDPALFWALPAIAIVSIAVVVLVHNEFDLKTEPSVALGVVIGLMLFAFFRLIRRNQRAGLKQKRGSLVE